MTLLFIYLAIGAALGIFIVQQNRKLNLQSARDKRMIEAYKELTVVIFALIWPLLTVMAIVKVATNKE